MDADDSTRIAERTLSVLKTAGVDLADGLSDQQLGQAQELVGSTFPPDISVMLAIAVPSGPGFPNWSNLGSEELADQIHWPVSGVLFDIEHNNFWHPEWPRLPEQIDKRLDLARAELVNVPPLVPIYGHRYLPTSPLRCGNPVLSMMQTDIIYYGSNLVEYAENDFLGHRHSTTEPVTAPKFWSYFL